MAVLTQPNVSLTSAWTPVASGVANVTVQVLGAWPALVFIGTTAPVAGSTDGSRVSREMSMSGLTNETVYARAEGDRQTVVSVVRG